MRWILPLPLLLIAGAVALLPLARLVRRNGEGVGLTFEHVRIMQRALKAADGAADVVVDALAAQTKHE